MKSRTNKQVLRSRAFRALAQDDMPRRALKEKKGGTEVELSLFFFSPGEASKHVILSAEGAKDLLLGFARGMANA
jgi:hypothetical protein